MFCCARDARNYSGKCSGDNGCCSSCNGKSIKECNDIVKGNTTPNGNNTDPNGNNTDPDGNNTDPGDGNNTQPGKASNQTMIYVAVGAAVLFIIMLFAARSRSRRNAFRPPPPGIEMM